MIGRILNMPFKVLSRAARTFQDRNDAAMKERHGLGDDTDNYDFMGEIPTVELPPGFDPTILERSAADLLAMTREKDVVVVDLRPTSAFRIEHVANAFSMPKGDLGIRIAELPPDTVTVFYDADPARARKGALFCRDRGLEEVWVLQGGLEAWKKAGGPVDRGDTGRRA
jgi:rhodanese-related sulfurtransferase